MTVGIGRAPTRYLVVGALCALVSNLTLIGSDAAGLHYIISTLLASALILPFSYILHSCWTFEAELSWAGLGRFSLGSLSSIVAASATVAFLSGLLTLPMIITAPLATAIMLLYNFLMTRWAVRRRRTD